MSIRFQDVQNLLANEPMEILAALDQTPEDFRKHYFPNYQAFLASAPADLLPLLKEGISKDVVVERRIHAGVEYRRLENNTFWNSIGIAYMIKQKFDKSRTIFEEMEKAGASDSATLTNYGAAILNRMIAKHQIEPSDEPDFEKAKNYIFKAFMFDVEAKPRQNIADAANFPAFKNIVLIRNIEAELYYNKGLYFIAFVLGWISVEMSLIRIWCKFMQEQGGEKEIRAKLSQWDAERVLDTLLMLQILPREMITETNSLRKERNKLIHGTLANPTPGNTMRVIQLGRILIPVKNT